MINYSLEFSLLYAFCGICYLLVSRGTQYKALRGFIICSLLVSLILPLIPAFTSSGIQGFSIKLPGVLIQSAAGKTSDVIQQSSPSLSLISLVSFAFLTVSSLIGLRLLYSLTQLIRLIKGSTLEVRDNVTLAFSKKVNNPCSFFNYILLPKYYQFDREELKVVLKHETYHIKFCHSLEKIVFETANIFFWWHPVHYLFRRQQTLLHEYEVDQAMLQTVQLTQYKDILLQLIINPPGLRMTNPFSSNIKQRIKMMNKQKKKQNLPLLTLTFVLMTMGMLLIHACSSDQIISPPASDENSMHLSDMAPPPAPPSPLLVTDTVYTFDLDTGKEKMEIISSIKDVYKTPDVMPHFPGCDDSVDIEECSNQKMLHFVYNNITYPAEAKSNHIEGMVVAKFVVGPDGKIFNQKIVRSPNYSLDESVLEMLDMMQDEIDWIPGKYNGKNVNVEYVLPVKFKLQ